jgi:HAD superfamily hydrolase (TIGR01490 family)
MASSGIAKDDSAIYAFVVLWGMALTHIFDVDYTLIRKSTGYYFLLDCLKARLIRFRQLKQLPFEYARYRIGHANHDFIEDAVAHLPGIDQEILEETAQICFETRLKKNLFADGVKLIQELQSRDVQIVLATSSFSILIKPLQDYLGIRNVIASELEFTNGKTSGRLLGKAVFGANKKMAVEAWLGARGIEPRDVWFYTDSYTDLPLLELAGHPVAVNPDRILATAARKNVWPICRWT